MTAIVTRGDAANLLLPDETVDLIVTSPPYFGLRSYQDGGKHYAGQVGDEATPAEYLDALVACTAEWVRVLKPGGSIFVNLGDKYNSAAGGGGNLLEAGHSAGGSNPQRVRGRATDAARPKSLLGLPWRYAIRCIDELGLILRAEIVWAKPNGLPESVTDRVRRSHEQVFHFVKQPRYYSAVDEVREAHTAEFKPAGKGWLDKGNGQKLGRVRENGVSQGGLADVTGHNPLGKLPGSVWTIATAPLKVPAHLGIDHFAAFPPELVRRIVLGWSPREVCMACGEGRRPVVHRSPAPRLIAGRGVHMALERNDGDKQTSGQEVARWKAANPDTITGYACACPDTDAPATPGVVLDPFGGTGTTALVASCYGRVGISVDLSADYCRLARWRTSDPGERARVLGVEKPPQQVDGQLGMFEGMDA